MSTQSYYAHGKLMLTGEYVVLDGAKSIAIPTKFGQKMQINNLIDSAFQVEWNGYNYINDLWIKAALPSNNILKEENLRLQNILSAVDKLNPELFLNKNFSISTFLEFPNNWGLGSSSTLISLLAQWSGVNPYFLLEKTFGGSGYDIAAATADTPISYIKTAKDPIVESVQLNEEWTKNAYFIFLGKKKNSRDAIQHYKALGDKKSVAKRITYLSDKLLEIDNTQNAIDLFVEHEAIMSNTLETPSINQSDFKDFDGVCKSLGAWGGDFIMAISQKEEKYIKKYFANKGLNTFFAYKDMIWK